jgi:tetratricopeptide (TPR) repeat protein
MYASIPSVKVASADAKLLEDPKRVPQAFPFAGMYHGKPARNYFKLGAAFYWAGYPDRALPYVEEELRRNPQNWKAWNAVARIHFEAERYKEALDAYRRSLAIRPEYAATQLSAGEAALKLGEVELAEKLLRSALDDASASADAANQLGLLRVKQNKAAEAKQWFEKAIEARRDHSGAINNLGVLYMQLGQANDAIAAFEFGIQQVPDDGQLYLNLGRVYVALGQTERARETMHRLLARKPGDPTATKALAALSGR